MTEEEKAVRKFVRELTKLSRKHGIVIGGCGCCGSPYLMTDPKRTASPEAGYTMSGTGDLGWAAPKDYDWDEKKESVIK